MQACISEYLDQVTAGIRSQKRQMMVRAELAGHFTELTDALTRDGLSEEDAARQAIMRMGDAFEVREKLTQANRVLPGKIGVLAGIGLVVIAGLFSILSTGAGLTWFFDPASFLIVLGIGGGIALLGGIHGLTPVEFFRRLTVTSLYGGGIGFLTGLIVMLRYLDDPNALGPGVSVALLCLFYGLVASGLSYGLKTLLPTLKPLKAREILQLKIED